MAAPLPDDGSDVAENPYDDPIMPGSSSHALSSTPLTSQAMPKPIPPGTARLTRTMARPHRSPLVRSTASMTALTCAAFPSLGIYSGQFVGVVLAALQSNPDIVAVAADDDVFVAAAVPAMAVQTNAPWHLSRISSRAVLPAKNLPPLRYNATAGQGVDVRHRRRLADRH